MRHDNKFKFVKKYLKTAWMMPQGARLSFFKGLYNVYYWPDKNIRAEGLKFFDLLKQKNFTQNWINSNIYAWLQVLAPLRDQPFDYLEIGSWEGTSAYFLAHHFPQAKLTCIDTWQGSDEHVGDARVQTSEEKFDANMTPFAARVTKKKGFSSQVLPTLHGNEYDVIYIDGSHYADDVLLDALNAWPLLKQNGVLIFDDILWKYRGYPAHKWPHQALKLFLQQIPQEYRMLHAGPQVLIRKIKGRAQ
jgi:predicted O-methyltransferase YrrM